MPMPECQIAELASRAVIEVTGADAFKFLQGLVTSDVARTRETGAVHAALLTPQGKILFDFMVVAQGDGFLLDCWRPIAADLARRLGFYKLRASVEVAEASDTRGVWAAWGADPATTEAAVVFADPRLAALGHRLIAPRGIDLSAAGCAPAAEADYHAHRIALGVPEGGLDFAYGDAFPHEADFDQLGGIDFAKGCFIGQEVVSRMQHRGTARKRIVPVDGDAALTSGSEISAGGPAIGALGSVADRRGLAMVRLDRAEKALREGKRLEAGGVAITLLRPLWATFPVPAASGEES